MNMLDMTTIVQKLQYLERKPHQSSLVFIRVLYPGQIGIKSIGICGGRKPGVPEEKPLEQAENQQQNQPTYGPGWNQTLTTPV